MDPITVILSVDSLRQPLTGIGRYTYELAKGLAEHEEVDDVRLLDRYKWCQRADDLIDLKESSSIPSASHRLSSSIRSKPLLRDLSRAVVPVLKTLRCLPYRNYIYHSPNYALPAFPGKCVTTIHDLSVIRHPEFHPKERVDHLLSLFPSILRRADLILTDSEFSRCEIMDHFGVEPDRVVAVPLGVDPSFRPMADSIIDEVLPKYGLRRGQYTLSVGTIEPRKNLERLIQAYEGLPMTMRKEFPLVLVGNEGWNSESIHDRMQSAQSEGWLLYLRYVKETDLPSIFAGARLFACVSVYEGFGLPVLEALASGTAVVCSRAASLPEVGGTVARYVDALATDSIRSACQTILENDCQRRSLERLGLQQASGFSWERTVSDTVTAYKSI